METAIYQGNAYRVERVHISQVKPGDTILHTDGLVRTVCRNNIHRDSFWGISLFGYPYLLGTKPVIRFITDNNGNLIAAKDIMNK